MNEPPIRAVNPGDEWIEAVQGGVIRRRATERGFVIAGPDGDRFIPFEEVVSVVQEAARSRSQQRRLDVQKKGDADGNGE